jgi:hypothetical protein
MHDPVEVRVSAPRFELRSRYRGWLYCGIIFLFVAAGIGAVVGTELRLRKRRAEAIANAVQILDREYQTCTLGTPARDAQLGQLAMVAELTGHLTASRVRACMARATADLGALNIARGDDHTLDAFSRATDDISDGFTSPDGLGLCEQISRVRRIARDLGTKGVAPDCASHFATLAPTFEVSEGASTTVVQGRELLIDVTLPGTNTHVLRRTLDGVSWTEAAPLNGWSLDISRGGVFAASRDEAVAHYQVLEGLTWHAGTSVHGRPRRARHTRTGWTLINDDGDGVTVMRLDDRMDHILETTPIPALRDPRTYPVKRVGFIDAEGNAIAIRVAGSADHVDFEAHRVAVGGKPTLVTSLKLADHKDLEHASTCQTETTMYVVIDGVGVVASSDGGLSFKTLANSGGVDARRVACVDDRLYTASVHGVTTCDRARCSTRPLPVMRKGPLRMDLELRDHKPQLLVTTNGFAMLFDLPVDSAELTLVSEWSWHDFSTVASVRIDGTWFVLSFWSDY